MAPPQHKSLPQAAPKCWTTELKLTHSVQPMSRLRPLTKVGRCICNKHLVDGVRRRHPFLSAGTRPSSLPRTQIPVCHRSTTHTGSSSRISWIKTSTKSIVFFCFFSSFTKPTPPPLKWFVLSDGNQLPRQRCVTRPHRGFERRVPNSKCVRMKGRVLRPKEDAAKREPDFQI